MSFIIVKMILGKRKMQWEMERRDEKEEKTYRKRWEEWVRKIERENRRTERKGKTVMISKPEREQEVKEEEEDEEVLEIEDREYWLGMSSTLFVLFCLLLVHLSFAQLRSLYTMKNHSYKHGLFSPFEW